MARGGRVSSTRSEKFKFERVRCIEKVFDEKNVKKRILLKKVEGF